MIRDFRRYILFFLLYTPVAWTVLPTLPNFIAGLTVGLAYPLYLFFRELTSPVPHIVIHKSGFALPRTSLPPLISWNDLLNVDHYDQGPWTLVVLNFKNDAKVLESIPFHLRPTGATKLLLVALPLTFHKECREIADSIRCHIEIAPSGQKSSTSL
jgi:hypothetical protein